MTALLRKRWLGIYVLFCLCMSHAAAQPQLPDLQAIAYKGFIILAWDCQYEGVKSIAVKQSADSMYNYRTIGYVHDLQKGVQFFSDNRAYPGNNYYKLSIVFNSDLVWQTNWTRIWIDSSFIGRARGNLSPDTARRIVKEEVARASWKEPVAMDVQGSSASSSARVVGVDGYRPSFGSEEEEPTKETAKMEKEDIAALPNSRAKQTGTEIRTTNASTVKDVKVPAYADVPLPPHHFHIDAPEGDLSDVSSITSRYISVNSIIGHIIVSVPDAAHHHYELHVFDLNQKAVFDVPEIRKNTIIIDRRNFRHKGIYNFRIMRDGVLFDYGQIDMNL